MANQSLVALPPDLEDPLVLKRFLARLVEQLDIVLGNKSDLRVQSVNQKELVELSKQLTKTLKKAEATLEQTLEQTKSINEKDLDELANKVSSATGKNNQQDTRLNSIETLNSQQSNRLNAIEGNYLVDAPSNGNKYVRQNGAWVIIS